MGTMRAVEVREPGGALQLVEREIPEPGPGWVRIKVEACGICHSDSLVKEGLWPGLVYPRIPGHEVAGRVDAVGPGVSGWPEGQRVGVGWYGGHCGVCVPCRHGNLIQCRNPGICGITFDGGYADYLVAPAMALARIPDDLSAHDAAPLLCAGITTFNALRHSGAKGGDVVAVHGVGGLGHLGVQFANRLGFRVVAISRGEDKRDLAMQLGAHRYIDTDRADPARELAAMGGASVILATAPSGKAMSTLLGGLAVDGTLMVVGASADPIEVPTSLLIMTGASIKGWASGTSIDSEETLAFSTHSNVRPMIETFPLDRATEAYDRMMSNKVRFRAVLTMT